MCLQSVIHSRKRWDIAHLTEIPLEGEVRWYILAFWTCRGKCSGASGRSIRESCCYLWPKGNNVPDTPMPPSSRRPPLLQPVILHHCTVHASGGGARKWPSGIPSTPEFFFPQRQNFFTRKRGEITNLHLEILDQ